MRQLKITNRVTNRDTFSLEKYLIDVSKFKMISLNEELILAKKIKKGDPDALNKLVSANLRFVISVVKQYQNQGLPLQDLINEGNLGLIKAAQRFDSSRGFKFISYAVWWIRQSVLQALAVHGRVVRLPSNKIGMINKLKASTIFLEQKFEREPTYEELAEETNIDIENIEELNIVRYPALSMDCPLSVDNDDGEMTLYDIAGFNDFDTPDNELIKESVNSQILYLLNKVTDKEKIVIEYYYGLNGKMPITFGEIENEFGIPEDQARRLKKSAIRKLKKCLQELN